MMPDDYGRHEVLHMANFLADSVDTELCEHSEVLGNTEWKALAEQARDALVQLYHAIARVHLYAD